jgi:hypothetical protein
MCGMTYEMMIDEARQRQAYNRSRAKLRSYLASSAGTSDSVSYEDLVLSAKLAKIKLPNTLLMQAEPYEK